MTVQNPIYSFMKFENMGYSLPIFKGTDPSFQFIIVPDDLGEKNTLLGRGQDDIIFIDSYSDNLDEAFLTDEIAGIIKYYEYGDNILAVSQMNDVLPDVTCFRYAIKSIDTIISNVFNIIPDDEFSVKLSYRSNEDSSGFIYCEQDDFYNSIRIPMTLWKPQFIDDETVYIRSDGSRKISKSVTSKEYEGITDYLPIWVHERIKIALSSDIVNVESEEYTGGIVKDGNYELQYSDKPIEDVYMATFKAFQSPYFVENTNCGICIDNGNLCGKIININGNFLNDNTMQAGMIVMWGGAVSSIPTGWHLCDGTNGTRDLRDLFILGAGGAYSVGATGGEATHTLTVEEMPAHTHTYIDLGPGNPDWGSGGYDGGDNHFTNASKTTDSQGGGAAHNNMPPYYALAYIQKL